MNDRDQSERGPSPLDINRRWFFQQCGVGLALVGGGAAHGGGCGFAGLVGLVLVHQSKSGQRAAGPGTDLMDFYLWLK